MPKFLEKYFWHTDTIRIRKNGTYAHITVLRNSNLNKELGLDFMVTEDFIVGRIFILVGSLSY